MRRFAGPQPNKSGGGGETSADRGVLSICYASFWGGGSIGVFTGCHTNEGFGSGTEKVGMGLIILLVGAWCDSVGCVLLPESPHRTAHTFQFEAAPKTKNFDGQFIKGKQTPLTVAP